jgi:hypothetical protein
VSARCNNSTCEADATRVMAMPPGAAACVFVSPYCDEHAEEIVQMGGWAAAGPALAEELRGIEGVRR